MPNNSLQSRNFIISRLSNSDLQLIEPHLEKVDLPVRKMLEPRQRRIDYVYFVESGFASVVANSNHKKPIEVGIIGREGMSGLAVILGHDRPENETYMQASGHGLRMKTGDLQRALDRSHSLHRSLLRYVHCFINQTSRTVVANGNSSLEERLARWLLLIHDRLDGEALPVTQEFLALMLAVRRPGVTIAIQALERKGLIEKGRGFIVLRDRPGLEKLSSVNYVAGDY